MSQSKKNQPIDAKKLQKLIRATGKSPEEWSVDNGWSKAFVKNIAKQGVCSTPNLKYMALLLGVAEKDLQPDPEPVQEEIKIEQYPVGDSEMMGKLNAILMEHVEAKEHRTGVHTIYMREFMDIHRAIEVISRQQSEILNAIQAIGGADEIVDRIVARQKPRQVADAEQMLRKMFNTCGKQEAAYGAFYNNCKAKVDGVTLQQMHEAISNMGCEIVNADGGRVIKAIVKEIK